MRSTQCIVESHFEAIKRYAFEKGILIDESNIVQGAYGGIGLSIVHNSVQWMIEADEYNEQYILSHLNIASNRKKKQKYHEHLRSRYYSVIIKHIYTHHNSKERKITSKNRSSIALEKAFQKVERQREEKLKLIK